MSNLLISNIFLSKVNKILIERTVKAVLFGEKKELAEISIVFLEADDMQEINYKYRKKNTITDVLSFPHNGEGLEGTGINFIGEIFICPKKIEQQAKENSNSYRKEMIQILIHGTLHLLNYDHEKSIKDESIMNQKEKHYLSIILNDKNNT